MAGIDEERKYFWDTYQEILKEYGSPFTLRLNYNKDGTMRHYAQLNGYPVNRCFMIEFIPRRKRIRYGVYLGSDVAIYRRMSKKDRIIEYAMGFPCEWRCGDRNKAAKRVYREEEITFNDHKSYKTAIRESIPKLVRFIKICTPYLDRNFKEQL